MVYFPDHLQIKDSSCIYTENVGINHCVLLVSISPILFLIDLLMSVFIPVKILLVRLTCHSWLALQRRGIWKTDFSKAFSTHIHPESIRFLKQKDYADYAIYMMIILIVCFIKKILLCELLLVSLNNTTIKTGREKR